MSKKQNIIQAAARLFAEQGFEGTTTLQIAKEAGVTEPLIYYHFKGKDDLFSHILETSFKEYFSRLEALEREPGAPFQRIEALLDFHFRFVEEMPDETTIGVSTSPAKLKNPNHIGRSFCNGWLKSPKTSAAEIGNLMAIVECDMKDAVGGGISADWRFRIAYNAALKLCTILLYAEGYRLNEPCSAIALFML